MSLSWKQNWKTKVFDDTIVEKWKAESLDQGLTEDAFQMAIRLAQSMAKRPSFKCDCDCECQNGWEGPCTDECICTENCCECDLGDYMEFVASKKGKPNDVQEFDFGNDAIKSDLMKQVGVLENVPEDQLDWHPGSNEQVLDLIHPSLYPYIRGISKLASGKLELPGNEKTRYQWLPAEFQITRDDDFEGSDSEEFEDYMVHGDIYDEAKIEIKSYINNLDRNTHGDLYETVGKVFSKFVPYFELVLKKRLPQKCQVIVKAANIVLTPEKPKYHGGSWHIEGMPYEKIVATGIYYYDVDNIRDSKLEFRRAIEESIDYPQNNHEYVWKHYGIKDGQPLNQYLGAVKTDEEKCIVFPNYLQHHVDEFSLADEKAPGRRKILVFFLIDPDHRILSTQDVPEQQSSMTLEQAKEHRKELMFHRKFFTDELNENVYEREFSLCEH
jgi:hypothetical protein